MDLDKVINTVIDTVTPEVYSNLKKAVELGKWDNGLKLSKDQLENSLKIIIAYDTRHKSEDERVGYIPPKSKPGSDEKEWQTLSVKETIKGSAKEPVEEPVKE